MLFHSFFSTKPTSFQNQYRTLYVYFNLSVINSRNFSSLFHQLINKTLQRHISQTVHWN
jgi:hypothetical protein